MRSMAATVFKWRIGAIIAYNKLMAFLAWIVPRKKMTVILEQGTLQGLHYKTRLSNKPYVSFLGIPYAKPPINNLRFKAPVKHPGWNGILKAFSTGKMCMQYDVFVTKKIVGSEDCLYLNVFVPQEESNEKKAVMVFIHGGAFNYGSGSLDFYSPDYLLDENVIVVTINYRLNVLGFLNFDINECPGNMGLKDQLFALKWVKANISAFGGDTNNITIFGESAGSASVHYHTLSPRSTGLFQRAIMQSGNAFNVWAFNERHKEAAYKLAKLLGCKNDNPKEIVEYLLKVPAVDLVKCTSSKFKFEGQRDLLNIPFVPSIENNAISEPFLHIHPEILTKTASPVPLITGINSMEGMIIFGEHRLGKIFDFHKTEEMKRLFESNFSEGVINKVKNFYFYQYYLQSDTTKLENTCHLFSDVFFTKEFPHSFNYLLKKGVTPVYNYEFKFDGELNMCKQLLFATRPLFQSLKGACHADELNYLFYGQLFGFLPKLNSPEYRMCRIMSKLWCNFAKTGNPNSPDLNVTWNSTSINDPKYLSLDGDNTCMVDELLNSSRMNFWKQILEIVQLKQKL
ncbi:Carboxylesterase type B, conserved site,Carboxylesterase, type B,Carboxylesterase type B [Cinara cedri]|uniref:Carboxylic ester hydrolase n=1 Tax=Cinara cedri TaxID=506608 RepID=A0A5E4NBH6_9HEMI|nr:Carboxylesterase type B, conserved site,Carboxylesterase, type B,Carboxylesterase type B [Cinara cedri]